MDTATKRFGAVNLGSPWRNTVPAPDGSFGAGDRQTLTYLYPGILFGGPAPAEVTFVVPAITRTFAASAVTRTFAASLSRTFAAPAVTRTFAAPAITRTFVAADPE